MMYQSRTESKLPELTLLPQNDLGLIVKQLISRRSSSFQFRTLVSEFANHISTTGKGFKGDPNTHYNPTLDERDVTRIREIIWDLIIDRYLTPGGYMDDTWSQLTISERGLKYFESYT